MKGVKNSLIIFLLSTLGLQAAIWNEQPTNFVKGKTYQYRYISQVLSGLPKSSAEFNGLQINSLVELSFEKGSTVYMTLKETEITESIKNIRSRNVYNFVDGKYFKKVHKTDPKSFKKLSLPIQFYWKITNKISKFKVLPDDDDLSINIKRGVLNMLNMELKLDENDWESDGKTYHIPNDEGIEGICEANYAWMSFPYKSKNRYNYRLLMFTRTKSANKCSESAGIDFANFLAWDSDKDKTNKNRTLVKNTNHVSMNISLSKSKDFFIWEAESKSSYSIRTKDILKETMSTFIAQSLKFVKVFPSAKIAKLINMKENSLIMKIKMIEKKLTKDDKERIAYLINRLGNMTENSDMELISLLRLANDQDMKEISRTIRDVVLNEEEIRKRYLDVLSEVLTYPTAKVLVQDYVLNPNSIYDDNQMALRLGAMAGINSVPEREFLDLLTSSTSNSVLLRNKNRHNTLKTVWLTIGTLSGAHYSQNPKYDIKSTIKFFTKVLMSLETSLEKETKNVVILKALGNMGTMKILPYLSEILNNKDNKPALRVQAIYSLRKIPRKDTKIELMLTNIYNNINEQPEIRIAAALDILMRHTCKLTVTGLVSRLTQEPIQQVRAYIQDLIISLSKAPTFKDTYLPLLRLITIKEYSNEYSKLFSIPTRNGAIHFSIIYHPEKLVPRTGNILFMENIFGKVIIPIEIGFRLQEPDIIYSFKDYFLEALKRQQYLYADYPPLMTLFIKRFDNEIGYFSVDREFPNFVNSKSFYSGFGKYLKGEKILNTNYNLNRMFNGEIHLPTTMGLKYSAQVHSHFDFRLDMAWSKLIDLIKKSSKFKFEIKSQMMMETNFDFGIDAGYIKSGVNTKVLLITPKPINITATFNEISLGFSIAFKKPNETRNLLKYISEKNFKVTYFNSLDDINGISKYLNITSFYTGGRDRKVKVKILPFPFGMALKYSYYCDVGKPTSGGHQISWFSPGDHYFDLWIIKNKSSDFDEFSIELKEEIFHETRKFILSANYLKNQKNKSSIDLIIFKLVFGYRNRAEILWPENLEPMKKMLQMNSSFSKGQAMKYVKLSASFDLPKMIVFNQSNPLQILRYQEPYTFNLNTYVRNSKGSLLYNMKINLGIDKEAKELGDEIAKDLNKYSEDDELLSICSQDIERGLPNSPACLQKWVKLNNYNMFKVSLNWTRNGLERLKKVFNNVNLRKLLANSLDSVEFVNNVNDYEFTYKFSPYYYRSTIITVSIRSLTNIYKYITYSRIHLGKNILERLTYNRMVSSDNKICQLRKGKNKIVSVKTFDNYFYTINRLISKDVLTDARSIIFVQDAYQSIQVIGARTSTEIMIQILVRKLPLLRIIKIGNDIQFYVNNTKQLNPTFKIDNDIVATFKKTLHSVYGNKTLYEIYLPSLNVGVKTDLDEILDITFSKDFWSILRGLCGDMNGELFNEFTDKRCDNAYSSPGNQFLSEYKRSFKDIKTDENIGKFLVTSPCTPFLEIGII